MAAMGGRRENVEGRLEKVEGRLENVALQIVQLRTEMSSGFSAVRSEMTEMRDGLRNELREDIAAQGREMAGHFLELEQTIKREIWQANQKIMDKLNER